MVGVLLLALAWTRPTTFSPPHWIRSSRSPRTDRRRPTPVTQQGLRMDRAQHRSSKDPAIRPWTQVAISLFRRQRVFGRSLQTARSVRTRDRENPAFAMDSDQMLDS